MVSSGRSKTFSSVITSSSTGLALPVAGVYTFYTSSLCYVPYRNRTSGTSAFSVKAVTHRSFRSLPCPRGRGGRRRALLRPRPSRSGRTLRGAVVRAASRACRCTRIRCRTPREGKPDHEQEQDHADHPVEFPRRLVAAREEHLAHVQPDKRHQEVRRPVVDAADELTEVRLGHNVIDGVPRVVRGWCVVEEKQDARQKLQRYGEQHRAAQSVEPGAAFGNWLVEKVLEHRDNASPVLHPSYREVARFRRLGPYAADHARCSLSRPRRVVACPGRARCRTCA